MERFHRLATCIVFRLISYKDKIVSCDNFFESGLASPQKEAGAAKGHPKGARNGKKRKTRWLLG